MCRESFDKLIFLFRSISFVIVFLLLIGFKVFGWWEIAVRCPPVRCPPTCQHSTFIQHPLVDTMERWWRATAHRLWQQTWISLCRSIKFGHFSHAPLYVNMFCNFFSFFRHDLNEPFVLNVNGAWRSTLLEERKSCLTRESEKFIRAMRKKGKMKTRRAAY